MGQFKFTMNANNSFDYTALKDPNRSYLWNSYSIDGGCLTTR